MTLWIEPLAFGSLRDGGAQVIPGLDPEAFDGLPDRVIRTS